MLALGGILGGYKSNQKNRLNQLLLLYLLGSLAIDLLARWIGHITFNNLILFVVLSQLELLVFAGFYFTISAQKKRIWMPLLLGIGYTGYELFSVQSADPASFQSYSIIVVAFLIVIMAFLYLVEVIRNGQKVTQSLLTLNYVILCFFALEFILMLPMNFMVNSDTNWVLYLWFMHLTINLLFYLFLIRYLWKHGNSQRPSLSGS